MSISPSVIRINGKQICYTSNHEICDLNISQSLNEAANEGIRVLVKPIKKNKNTINLSIWSATGIMLYQAVAKVQPSMWKEIIPVFNVFQEIAMVTGALAIITGLIIMIFKRKVGWTIINTAGLVVLGCFLVPSAVMLVAIIGKLLNSALTNAFDAFYQG